ncbi:MAG TPA: phosphatase PAP2 family protein [Amycolatopsis sp.]|nr:phosphatase PAP2 family protein [Amycolatopsis sp.]
MKTAVRSAPAALPVPLRRPLTVVALLAAIVVVVLGVLHFHDSGLTGLDAAVLPSLDGVQPPWRYLALVFDFCGEPVGATLLVAAITIACLAARRVRTALLTVLGIVVTVGVTTVLKPLVGRTIHGGYLSYPSGHTALATALTLAVAMALTSRFGRLAAFAVVLASALVAALAMGWAEVALGAHYPTDAVGGFCAALAVIPAVAWLVDRVADRI